MIKIFNHSNTIRLNGFTFSKLVSIKKYSNVWNISNVKKKKKKKRKVDRSRPAERIRANNSTQLFACSRPLPNMTALVTNDSHL